MTANPEVPDLARLLADRLSADIRDVRPLGAGQWSRAFSFDADGKPLVVRLGDQDEDFAKDRIAASWQVNQLPVPGFVQLGEAFGTYYAVTERAEGKFLDHLTAHEVADVLPSLFRVLAAQRQVPVAVAAGFGIWDRAGVAGHRTWKDALLAVASERPRIAGWKNRLQAWPECQEIFTAGFRQLTLMVDEVPSRQDVVHGDLLNRNVLVNDVGVTAIFDWGSSLYGDHLYDVAWLAFCAPYTAGFDRLGFRRAARRHYADAGIAPDDFDRRVDCYEVHIGLAGMTYQAFVGNRDAARMLADQTRTVLALS